MGKVVKKAKDGHKFCNGICGLELSFDKFNSMGNGQKGISKYAARCKNCAADKNNPNRKKVDLFLPKKVFVSSGFKVCEGICGLLKCVETEFYVKGTNSKGKRYDNMCIECRIPDARNRYKENKIQITSKAKIYRAENFTTLKISKAKYQQKNKTLISKKRKIYYTNNLPKLLEGNLRYVKERKKKDPAFKLRLSLSNSITKALKKSGASKAGQSILKFLPYTLEELKQYIESNFDKSWMNWENQGHYKIDEWNDSDPSTWKWQLDHIIPHSEFKYESMEEQTFRDCWALSNLRPLSAKQNLIDGTTRVRHLKKKDYR